LLDSDDICRDIVRYLLDHSEAADTASGIAEWWITRDIPRTATALTKLSEHGIVHPHVVQDVSSVYTFTKNVRLRENLREWIEGLPSAVEPR